SSSTCGTCWRRKASTSRCRQATRIVDGGSERAPSPWAAIFAWDRHADRIQASNTPTRCIGFPLAKRVGTNDLNKEWLMLKLTMGFFAVVLTACAVTKQAPLKPSAEGSGLVDYRRLSPGAPGQAQLRYINPDAHWTRYHAILIEPVTFWAAPDDMSVSPADQRMLCNFFQQALQQQFGQHFKLVDRDGRGVMVLQVALTSAEAATPVLRTVSMLIPQARVLATLKYLATGSYPFIGSAQVAARLSDSETGRVLGEWVD